MQEPARMPFILEQQKIEQTVFFTFANEAQYISLYFNQLWGHDFPSDKALFGYYGEPSTAAACNSSKSCPSLYCAEEAQEHPKKNSL